MITRSIAVQIGGPALYERARQAYARAARVATQPVAIAALIAVVAIVSAGWPGVRANSAPDDAFITYRYAWNLAHGNGFVFNPGDAPVQGTSTPLYTFLLTGGGVLGADIPALSIAIGAIATALSAVLLYALGRQLGYALAGFVAALLWAASPFTPDYLRGMETPVYIAFILAAFWAALNQRQMLALTLSALVVLTRMDGLAVVAVVTAYFVLQRRLSWRDAAPGALIVAAWFGFATLYFGSPVPESGLAKIAHQGGISGHFSPLSSYFVHLVLPLSGYSIVIAIASVLLVLVAAPLIVRLARAEPFARLFVAWLALYIAGFLVLGLPSFSWYYGPPAIVLTLLLWMGAEGWVRDRGWAALRFAPAIAVVAAAALLVIPVETRNSETQPAQWDAGVWLRDNAPPGSTVVAYEIGMVGYESGLRTVDLLGLTEPAAREHIAQRDYAWAVRDLKPAYVFTNPTKDDWPVTEAIFALPEFQANYELVARFAFRDGLDYLLYERIDAE